MPAVLDVAPRSVELASALADRRAPGVAPAGEPSHIHIPRPSQGARRPAQLERLIDRGGQP